MNIKLVVVLHCRDSIVTRTIHVLSVSFLPLYASVIVYAEQCHSLPRRLSVPSPASFSPAGSANHLQTTSFHFQMYAFHTYAGHCTCTRMHTPQFPYTRARARTL